MGKSYLVFTMFVIVFNLFGQEEKLELAGAIQIADSEDPSPDPGTIRWTGKNFEGWNGFTWSSLTSFAVADIIIDLDGNEYRTVQIGSQEWMAENLRVSQNRVGIPLVEIMDNDSWKTNLNGKFCWYDDDESLYKYPYGGYYDWNTSTGSNLSGEGVCPIGWKIPSNVDWTILQTTLGGSLVAGGTMKEQVNMHWNTPNTSANNASGFTAVGSGWRSASGSFGFFGVNSYFWSETMDASNNPFIWSVSHNTGQLFNNAIGDTNFGLSVRCIKE